MNTQLILQQLRRIVLTLVIALSVGGSMGGCPGNGGTGNDNGSIDDDGGGDLPDDQDDDGTLNDNGDDDPVGPDDDDGTPDVGIPIGNITGTETLNEGETAQSGGDSSVRNELFTATYTLTPLNVDSAEAFIDGVLTTYYFGELSGTAQLSYEETGSDTSAELECPTTNYRGSVEWQANISGTYEYTPALGTIRIDAQADNPSSPHYIVTYTTPGCPEFESQNPSMYYWQGPGQGTWGFVTIVLQGGHFGATIDNPQGDDFGAEDYYEIDVYAAGVP